MKYQSLALGLLMVGIGCTHAANDPALAARIDQRLSGDRTGACLAVALIEVDSITRAYRCADPADAGRIGAASAFEIGSVSKTMTTALLADLIAQGKASLDDALADHLPAGAQTPVFEGQPILLRHIVTHTSGLPVLPPDVPLLDASNPYAAIDADALLTSLERTELSAAPGSRFEYSNFAFMLLSLAVARTSGSDLETALSERLFAPLGMAGAYINRKPGLVAETAGHIPSGRATSAWTFRTDLAGVGGVRATLDDMVRYVQGQLGQIDADIAPALTFAQQPLPSESGVPFAMGWMLQPLAGRTLHAHEGGTGGFSSLVAFDRERQRGVVILSDTALHSLGGLGGLGLHLLDGSVPTGEPRRVATPSDELLDGLAGDYTLEGGLAMTLARQGDVLTIHPLGQPVFEMGYDSAGDFYPLLFDALLRPRLREDGRHSFSWHQGGGVVAATRVDPDAQAPQSLDPEQLANYIGEYPLMPGFSLHVRERGGVLHTQATGQGEFPVQPAGEDVFEAAAYGIELRFIRDAEGEVVSLQLHQGGHMMTGERR